LYAIDYIKFSLILENHEMVNSHKNKTVVDAVNSLQGELHKCIAFDKSRKQVVMAIHKEGFRGLYAGCYSVASFENGIGDRYWKVICTIDEFNQCVAEMSEGLFVPDCRPKAPEIQYDKDGSGWEVGAVYEFSNDKKDWYQASFSRMDGSLSEYKPNGLNWHLFARECQSQIGKIHKKPVVLVDGAAYQFDVDGDTFVGLYTAEYDSFQNNTSAYEATQCANIIKLVPESI